MPSEPASPTACAEEVQIQGGVQQTGLRGPGGQSGGQSGGPGGGGDGAGPQQLQGAGACGQQGGSHIS